MANQLLTSRRQLLATDQIFFLWGGSRCALMSWVCITLQQRNDTSLPWMTAGQGQGMKLDEDEELDEEVPLTQVLHN